MSRIVQKIAVLASLLLALVVVGGSFAKDTRPNILFIMSDDKYLESAAAEQKCRIFSTVLAKILVCELAPIEANSGRLT